MSCGKTPTRRHVHRGKRIVIVGHGWTGGGGSGPAVGKPARRPNRRAVPQKRRSSVPAGLLAWEKKHPFKNDWAKWAKSHPLKPFSRADWLAWEKKHPFKTNGHTVQQGRKHKVKCQVKTRHAVSATRGQRRKQHAKPTGKRLVIMRHTKGTKARTAVKARTALKAR